MTALAQLLIVAAASSTALPEITIEPCIEVDPTELRRLTAMELGNLQGAASLHSLHVDVGCEEEAQRLRVTTADGALVATREIDLVATEANDRDARTRELALMIAELLRRAATEPAPPTLPTATTAPPAPATQPARPEPTLSDRAATNEEAPSRFGLLVRAVAASWTGGTWLYGADLATRVHLGRWLIGEVSAGGRVTRPLKLSDISIRGRGVSGFAGLALNATPDLRQAGLSIGVRLGADWLDYAHSDNAGVMFTKSNATALSLLGSVSGFAVLSEPVHLTMDAAAGGALHSVVLQGAESTRSGLDGVVLLTAIGLALHF